jgi:hypothetical protein
MTTTAKPWAVGDVCPACNGDLKPVPAPSDAQRAAAANRDNPTPLPPTVDHATPEQIAELGDLHRCACGYQSRVAAATTTTRRPPRRPRASARPAGRATPSSAACRPSSG